MRPSGSARVLTFFLLDMASRVLAAAVAILVLGFAYRLVVGSVTIAAWCVIATVVFCVALARVCSAWLLVTAASVVGQSPSDLSSPPTREVAIALASPQFARFYIARLAVCLLSGLALAVFQLILDILSPLAGSHIEAFTSGLLAGVLYGYLLAGWRLAQSATSSSPSAIAGS